MGVNIGLWLRFGCLFTVKIGTKGASLNIMAIQPTPPGPRTPRTPPRNKGLIAGLI